MSSRRQPPGRLRLLHVLAVLCLVAGVRSVAAPGVPNGTASYAPRPSLATMEDGLPVLFGVAKLAAERKRESLGASESYKASPEGTCISEMADVWRGIAERELWALKMLDASGTPGSGFLWGNNYWLGSFSMCRSLEPRAKGAVLNGNGSALSPQGPPGEVEIFVATFRHRGSPQEHIRVPNEDLLSVALCAPNVCPEETLGDLLEESLSQRALPLQRLLGLRLQLEGVRSLRWHPETLISKPKFGIMAFLIFLIVFLLVAGTYYDVAIWRPALKKATSSKGESSDLSRKMGSDGSRPVDVELLVVDTNQNGCQSNNGRALTTSKGMMAVDLNNKPPKQEIKEARQGALGHFLMCFSVPRNTTTIFDTFLGEDSVCAIHGLRFMGMGWIIMVHTVYFLSDYCDNKAVALRKADGFMVQVVSNATLSVDTFFFISGFLLSYLFYKDEAKNKLKEQKKETFKAKVNKFFLMLLRRFMRLTPTYMVVLGIVDINMSWYNKVSFFTMSERADVVCSKYWWRNILYINNFFSREEMCMSWSWYLSNDMQFFVLGTFLMLLSTSYFVLSIIILVIILISSSVLTGYISYIYGYIPTLDEQLAMLNVLYDPPWTRIGPYLVGMCTGYLAVYLNGKLNLSKKTTILLWVLGSLCNIIVLFGIYERDISVTASAFYVALSRTVWGLGLAWIIIACCTGHAGIINSILSFGGWVPLSRLTYGAYLLNPVLMNSIYLSSESAWHIDFLPLAAVFLGHTCITYFCSYVLSLLVETPSILLMRWFVQGSGRRKQLRGRET
ncbi:nose resistant to fluoxetine protein 6-like [Ischnura elegans]|uniref:nose resistant to fluoxetine protein 6-like n=1 Tax=Ischnura elegans TaxID=197161 RepID=UPI001ED872DC|nr:nose resistant to fluoxetine protein 6-like [Ischnura elegans]XP_046403424.1 nose resistant to fluoxetine protein 6-like [Ischnura elegans]